MKNDRRKAEVPMKMTAVLAVLAVAACAARAGNAGDAVPRGFVYQGVLSDPVAGPLSGPQTVAFRIFADASGGDALWSASQDVFCGTGGVFHAWIEGGDELPEAFSVPDRLLELQVDGHGQAIAPRLAFTSVPQVLLARRARQSPLSFPVAGALSAEKVEVADVAKFDSDATFGELSVSGNAAWEDGSSPVSVAGTVSAGVFSGDGIPPVGSIAMWPGTEPVPAGWAPCDGTIVNGLQTPDLRDRFPVGVGGNADIGGPYACGQTGGTNEVTLVADELPAHSHSYAIASYRTFRYTDGTENNGGPDWWHDSVEGSTASAGGDSSGKTKAHENRPPYRAVCFIIRIP
jgi:microcystin-dependent protein